MLTLEVLPMYRLPFRERVFSGSKMNISSCPLWLIHTCLVNRLLPRICSLTAPQKSVQRLSLSLWGWRPTYPAHPLQYFALKSRVRLPQNGRLRVGTRRSFSSLLNSACPSFLTTFCFFSKVSLRRQDCLGHIIITA